MKPVVPQPLHRRARLVEEAVTQGLALLKVGHVNGQPTVLVPQWWRAMAPLTLKERAAVLEQVTGAARERVRRNANLPQGEESR